LDWTVNRSGIVRGWVRGNYSRENAKKTRKAEKILQLRFAITVGLELPNFFLSCLRERKENFSLMNAALVLPLSVFLL
jgi:hypothetical protein